MIAGTLAASPAALPPPRAAPVRPLTSGGLPVLALLILLAANGVATPGAAAAESVPARLAPQSLLLDVVRAGGRLVAVGERGHVLYSDDNAASWIQVTVPTRATLTAVAFADAHLGYAVGHDAVILRTRDGGGSWQRVHAAPEQERPLLDILVAGPEQAVAVGAYGYYLETRDQGTGWEERVLRTSSPEAAAGTAVDGADEELSDDFHLNHISRAETGRWYMAAEAGTLYRSDDQGRRWQRLPSPYEGSFFGVLPLNDDEVLVFGLQGRLFHSADAGGHWRRLETATPASLTAGLRLADGAVMLLGHAGVALLAEGGSGGFRRLQQPSREAVSAALELAGGELLLVGAGGIRTLSRPQLRSP